MVLSVSVVSTLFVWCIYKVLSTPEESKNMHGFEFETPDEKAQRQKNHDC